MDIAAVVVLYRPDEGVIKCITSYLDQVGCVFLVDNSEHPQEERFRQLCIDDRVEYVPLRDNFGIAKALNVGAELAIENGFDFLLTMDQDSTAAPGMVEKLSAAGVELGWEKIALISPMHRIGFEHEKAQGRYYDVRSAWTSGCLMNLKVYQLVGGFEDDLFIDFVDHEYCLRAKQLHYRVLKVRDAELFHLIGERPRIVHLLGVPLIVTNHSPLRRYYITRNRFYVTKKFRNVFFDFYWRDKVGFFVETIIILLFEDQKVLKVRMIFRGLVDYFRGLFGKCHYV